MDINIEIAELSAETKELLLRFQVAHLHYIMRDYFYDIPGEADWLREFELVRNTLTNCPEPPIAKAVKELNAEEFENALHRLSLKVADRRPEFFRQVN